MCLCLGITLRILSKSTSKSSLDSVFPTVQEEVLLLMERVSEAQRIAKLEMKDLEDKKKKRKTDDEDENRILPYKKKKKFRK